MLKLSCILLGTDYNALLKETAKSKYKVSVLGTALLIPVTIWFFTGYLFASEFFHCAFLVSLLVACAVGSLILLIERSIILSDSSKHLLIFRVILGLIVAILGSICLDEVLFKQDILKMKESVLIYEMNDDTDYIKSLRNEVATLDIVIAQKRDAAQNEAQGKSSGHMGVGEITQMINNQIEDYKSEKNSSQMLLDSELNKHNSHYLDQIEQVKNGSTDGALLYNIKSLYHLVLSDKFVAVVFSIVFLFFFFLEFLVVLLKNMLPETSYEKKLRMQETLLAHRMRMMEDRVLNFSHGYELDPSYIEMQKSQVGILS